MSWEFLAGILFAVIVAKRANVIIYHLKFWMYYIWTMTVSASLIPYFLTQPKNVLNLLVGAHILVHISKVLGLKFSVTGGEILKHKKTCVIVSNHQSSLDIIGMWALWPTIHKMTVVAKRELLLAGPFGIGAWLAGLTFINRSTGGKAGQAMNEAVEKMKKENIKLWVFPEGTRRNTGEIHEFKKGAFLTAIYTQVPIVPVVFSSYKSFLDAKKKTFSSGEVTIQVLPEISTNGLTAKDVDELMERTRNLMIEVYDDISYTKIGKNALNE